jgi:lysophospholipid acyltransferase (LPLAT)-like uncharacterized protein
MGCLMTVRRGPSDLSREPFRYRFLITVFGTIGYHVFNLFYKSSRRYRVNGEFEERSFAEGRPLIIAQYHYWDAFFFFAFRHRRNAIMCGDKWGGDLGAFIMAKLGIESVRRTTRPMDKNDPAYISGRQAKDELIGMVIDEGYNATMTVDGPRGPLFSVKPGIIDVAAATGAPIISMSVVARPHINAPTWERLWLPAPFSTIVTLFGGPVYVPADADDEKREEIRQTLERHMQAMKLRCEEISADRTKTKALISGEIRIDPLYGA